MNYYTIIDSPIGSLLLVGGGPEDERLRARAAARHRTSDANRWPGAASGR